MKLRHEIPADRVRNGIRWLEVEQADGGAYLFQYEDIALPCKWDTFYDSMEEALSDCADAWGVPRSEWREVA